MKATNALFLVAALTILQGCAFTKATLPVAHTPGVRVAGPIGEVASIQFKAPKLEDTRLDKGRIGWKKNGFGQNTADITTTQPVTKIVEDAISQAIFDNHHQIGDRGRVQISGSVDRFWFEVDVNFWTVKFIGDVQCTLLFSDAESGRLLYKSKYSGNYEEEKAAGLEKTWTVVMNKAVDKLMESVVLDDELAKALKTYQ